MVKQLFKVGRTLLGGGLLGVGLSLAKKKKKPGDVPLPGNGRDDAAALVEQQADILRRRRGSLDDILTGTRGAEAAVSGGRLIVGN